MLQQDGKIMSTNILETIINSSTLNSRIAQIQGHTVLVLSGEIDSHTALQFKRTVTDILNGDERDLIIDMHNVSYMDSSGLGILAYAIKRVSPKRGTVNLVGCNARIEHILYKTQMYAFLTLCENMNDALNLIAA